MPLLPLINVSWNSDYVRSWCVVQLLCCCGLKLSIDRKQLICSFVLTIPGSFLSGLMNIEKKGFIMPPMYNWIFVSVLCGNVLIVSLFKSLLAYINYIKQFIMTFSPVYSIICPYLTTLPFLASPFFPFFPLFPFFPSVNVCEFWYVGYRYRLFFFFPPSSLLSSPSVGLDWTLLSSFFVHARPVFYHWDTSLDLYLFQTIPC